MTIIYEPKGKAREYCALAANLYSGCPHGCSYCYAPKFTYKSKEEFLKVRQREHIIDQIQKEAPQYKNKEIHLCFTCDPYPGIEKTLNLTRNVIKILHANNIKSIILTKAGMESIKDFDLLTKNKSLSKYGASLTFSKKEDSLREEPFAATPKSRIKALKIAKEMNIPTWASFEPVISTEQTLELIETSLGIVDEFKIGKLNHDIREKNINWKTFAKNVIKIFEKNNIKNYYLKNDLRAFL